jgi:Holliday junction resolvase RusA-like endonuclease
VVIFSAIIVGQPRPKGNSRQVWKTRGQTVIKLAPSRDFLTWQRHAKLQLNLVKAAQGIREPIDVPLRVHATFFRDARADVDNLCKALGDVLQHAGVIKNDRLIVEWIACRRPPDGQPRVHVLLEAA